MKKVLSVAVLLVMMFTFVACSANEKIVATITQDDELIGKTTATLEINLKNNKAESAVMTMEFADEDTAKGYYEVLALVSEEVEKLNVRQEGNKIITNQTSINDGFEYDEMTKKEVIQSLKNAGWTVE